ncbi:unnamed protein product, partial [Mesorhabditis belari]|uniref:Uncharacterized protein n=1 Tax=Mesorhabditis belari TaxID=2138241 RepID=A0AAF3FDY6_9BILA
MYTYTQAKAPYDAHLHQGYQHSYQMGVQDRDFTNKMETKFFDGSIGPLIDRSIVMAEVEASKAKSANFAEIAERWKAELLQLRSDFNEVFNGFFGLKVTQPKSLSATSTTSVAVESVPEKEVVAEEPKKLDFPGIDLKTWEATE